MSFTPSQIWAFVIAFIGLVLSVLNILDKFATIKQRNSEPEREQNERLDKLEERVLGLEHHLDNDKKNIEELKASTTMNMKVLFALLNHSIYGDNDEELRNVQREIQIFLTGR